MRCIYRVIAMNDRGRIVGEDNPNAIFTSHEVELIRQLHEEGMTYSQLAEKFGVHYARIGKICRYETWAQSPTRFKKVAMMED